MPTTSPDVPTSPTVRPEPTVEQGERFLALLCRFGFDDVFDQGFRAAAAQRRLAVGTGESSPGLGVPTPSDVPDEGVMAGIEASFDIAAIIRDLGTGGALTELASIVYNLPPDEARKQSFKTLPDAMMGFMQASLTLIQMLLSFGSASA